MHAGAEREIYQRAKDLRNRSTPAEEVLWGYLKIKPHGFKFRRQHPYSIYILDFYCHALKLVIEVDGSIHNLKEVKNNDQQRQHLLEKDGLIVLRLTNEEILTELEKVIRKIEHQIHSITNKSSTNEPCSADAPL
jgi:cyclase